MLRRNSKFICFFVAVLFMFVFIQDVKAAVVNVGEKYYYYTTKNDVYGSYAGTSPVSGATRGTTYKTLDGIEAFCVQADVYSPKSGEEYALVNWGENVSGRVWNETSAVTAGLYLLIIDQNYTGEDVGKYVFKYAGLNSYLAFEKSENYMAYNSNIALKVQAAKDNYDIMTITHVLPSFGAKADNLVMSKHTASNGSSYYVGKFTLSNLISSYGTTIPELGGGPVTYTINLPSGAKLYNDAKLTSEAQTSYTDISGEKTFYVKYTGNNVGEQIQISIVGTNYNIYPVANLWKPVSTSSQLLVTYDTRAYYRSSSRVVTFEIPNVDQKTIKIVKKDELTGKNLIGSSLKLQLIGGSTKSCTVSNGKYSCSIPIDEDLVEDTYYSVIETTAPDGYILGPAIENVKWDVNKRGDVCYVSDENGLVETDSNDCNRDYLVNTVCTSEDGAIKEGACETIVDPSLPEDTPEEEREYITVGTEEKVCYYHEGETIVKVDDSKCNMQYVKVTNSSGNLVVEYFNKKNHVEISKVAINGEKELVGADLKICSNKPDANGDCTIVRNTLEGKCFASDTSSLSSEYNCVNNNDGTKTVDMHWVSGVTSKIWYGIPKGTYYIVETVAPSGYLPLSTYVEFSIDASGKVTSTKYNEETQKIMIENKPTNFSVVKVDAKNNEKLSGATLSICYAFKDKDGVYHLDVGADGYCVPAVLVDGTVATWVTTDKAKTISGLGVGNYFLVEVSAPENYSIADAIFFRVNDNGTITDKDGKLLTDNRIVMKDVSIINQKTGHLPILIISLIGVGAIGICGIVYYYLGRKNGVPTVKD